MAKPPTGPIRQDARTAAAPANAGPIRWLRMETSLSGPELCLNPGDSHPFDDTPGPNEAPSEAERMVDAGFAVDCDPPADA